MKSLMEKLKSIPKYDKTLYLISIMIMFICLCNKEHITSVICHGSLILIMGFYGVDRLKSMSCWVLYELSYLIYLLISGVSISNIIADTSGGVVVALVAIFLCIKDAENREKIIHLKSVYNIMIISIFITGIMTYARILTDYSNKILIAMWILTPTYIMISRLVYSDLAYLFSAIYYIAVGITTYQTIVVNKTYFELIEYLLIITSLILGYIHFKFKNKQL